MTNYWLMKSEPDVFSLDDLKKAPKKTEPWDGVRNYQARNFMRDQMKKGDVVLFYHSNCKEPGIVGVAEISSKAAYADPTQFDSKSKYHDPKSDPDNPRWYMVDIEFVSKVADVDQPVGLPEIKSDPKLADMELVRYGRLSVQSVKKAEFDHVKKLAGL